MNPDNPCATPRMKTYRLLRRSILFCVGLLGLANLVVAGQSPALETVYQVNLDRYTGTWYEIARLPNRFQDQCVGNVTADYQRLDDGNIRVINRCLDKDGLMDEAQGVARVVDTSSNAKLEVSFVSVFGWNLFWGDYWILDLGEEYEYAVIGMPSRKYAWVLARTLELSPEVRSQVRQVLIRAGYDPERLLETRHQESLQTD